MSYWNGFQISWPQEDKEQYWWPFFRLVGGKIWLAIASGKYFWPLALSFLYKSVNADSLLTTVFFIGKLLQGRIVQIFTELTSLVPMTGVTAGLLLWSLKSARSYTYRDRRIHTIMKTGCLTNPYQQQITTSTLVSGWSSLPCLGISI